MSAHQLPLVLDAPPLAPSVMREADHRGLETDPSLRECDRLIVGEIGGLIAGLNAALQAASLVGLDVVMTPYYQDLPERGRKRCVMRGAVRRVAFDVRV